MDKSKRATVIVLVFALALIAVLFVFFMPHRMNALLFNSGEPDITGAYISMTDVNGVNNSVTLEDDTSITVLNALWEYLSVTKASYRGRYTTIAVSGTMYSVDLLRPADGERIYGFTLLEGERICYIHDETTGGHKYQLSAAGAQRLYDVVAAIYAGPEE